MIKSIAQYATTCMALAAVCTITGISLAGATSEPYGDVYKSNVSYALNEMRAHLWALEKNLDAGSTELAVIHAGHALTEIYPSLAASVEEKDPRLESRFRGMLENLGSDIAGSREDADAALLNARAVIDETEEDLLGVVSDDITKAVARALLDVAILEYEEAVSDGEIVNLVEYQDGEAFVQRSRELVASTHDAYPREKTGKIDAVFDEIQEAYMAKSPGMLKEHIHNLADILHTGLSGSPLQQVISGVAPSQVECSDDRQLYKRISNGGPLCLGETAAEKLTEYGIIEHF